MGIIMKKRIKNIIEDRNQMDEIRLNKFLSDAGICSRREADRLIEDGRITVNGTKAAMGMKVSKKDKIIYKGKIVKLEEKLILIALNKPVGIECTADKKNPDNIVDFVGLEDRIYPIGRLDKNSSGLILLTNDGMIVNKILRANNNHEKEYNVQVDKPITNDFINKMRSGVPILDTVTKKCKVNKIGQNKFEIILTQGLNRQIRRMCESLGYKVTSLERVRIMNIRLGNLKTGSYRDLTDKELRDLLALTKYSIS